MEQGGKLIRAYVYESDDLSTLLDISSDQGTKKIIKFEMQ